MSSVKIIHEAAMEYYDQAKRAKIKGDSTAWRENLEKAYILEKEAALTMPEQPQNYMWRYILLRSAGWLGYQCGYFEEAKKLAEAGLSGKAPTEEKAQLTQLKKAASKEIKQKTVSPRDKDSIQISGVFTVADVFQNFIVIRDNGKTHTVEVPGEKIREVARLFLGDVVQVKTKQNLNRNSFPL
jgi:translation initiation factor IF-1